MSSSSVAKKDRHYHSHHSSNNNYDYENGFNNRSDHSNSLDAKCEKLLQNNFVMNFLNEDIITLNARNDHFPVFENFALEISSSDAKKKLNNDLRVGDELCFRIRRVELAGVYAEPVCTLHPFRRSLKWINGFQVLLERNLQAPRDYRPNDLIKVLVTDIDNETKTPIFAIDEEAGLLTEADLPIYFRNGEELGNKTFDRYLKDYLPATNPNYAALLGVETNAAFSFLSELKDTDFSSKYRAPYTRQKQNEDLSMSNAKRGVQKIREGENANAIQYFNKALVIFEKNVEALVGRAAAYANMGMYELAEADLDAALAINEHHTNARNYMVETLLQGAKKLEEVGKKDEARAKYEKIVGLKDDERAVRALKNLDKSPSIEIVERKNDTETKRKDKERMKEEERQRKKRRRDAEKLAEYERFIAELKSK